MFAFTNGTFLFMTDARNVTSEHTVGLLVSVPLILIVVEPVYASVLNNKRYEIPKTLLTKPAAGAGRIIIGAPNDAIICGGVSISFFTLIAMSDCYFKIHNK